MKKAADEMKRAHWYPVMAHGKEDYFQVRMVTSLRHQSMDLAKK